MKDKTPMKEEGKGKDGKGMKLAIIVSMLKKKKGSEKKCKECEKEPCECED